MAKLIVCGVGGNLGKLTADHLLSLVPKENLIFCSSIPKYLTPYADQGIETRIANFLNIEGLVEAFSGGDRLALISMPFIGERRQIAEKNAVDAAKMAGVKMIVYTSIVAVDDESSPYIGKKDVAVTEDYIRNSSLDYIFLRLSQFAEAMITNYFTFSKIGVLKNNMGDGKMAFLSRRDAAKALVSALVKGSDHKAVLNITGPQLLTISEFIAYGNQATGHQVSYQEIGDEENYAIFDAMGVPRNTDGPFKKDSEAPFSSDGMVSFGKALRLGKMALISDDFKKLTGESPLTVKYMFENANQFQIGKRHSTDQYFNFKSELWLNKNFN